jgi:hypothetical protein
MIKIDVRKYEENRFALYKYDTTTTNVEWVVYVDREDLVLLGDTIGKVLTNR